jgi:hypothetical protein
MRRLKLLCASVALLGQLALSTGPSLAAPASCSGKLTSSDISAASTLASELDTAITGVLADTRGQSFADLRLALTNALEAVLVNSNASPAIGRAALIQVRDDLSNQGLLCMAGPPQAGQSACTTVRQVLDLVTTSAQSAQQICATAIGDGAPALGPPPPGNSGGQGPGVTHPGVAPAI